MAKKARAWCSQLCQRVSLEVSCAGEEETLLPDLPISVIPPKPSLELILTFFMFSGIAALAAHRVVTTVLTYNQRKLHLSRRKRAHKHKLFALVNVQMALGQRAGCPRVNRAKKLCVRLETQDI